MKDLDMSGVDPLRWTEVRRRVEVVRGFIAIPAPTERDRKVHAASLGLSVNQFGVLVRAWKEHGTAARLAGAGAFRGASRRPSRLAVPEQSKVIAAAVIKNLGATAPFVEINAEVAARCEHWGLRPPSRSTIWNMVAAARQNHKGEDDGVIVGTCQLRLPVETDGGVDLPFITLAVRSRNGAVLAAAMSSDPMDWPDLIASVAGQRSRMKVDQTLFPQGMIVPEDVMLITSSAARSALSQVLGRGIGDLRLIYRPSKAIAPERLLTSRVDKPLTLQDARGIAVAAIARHNATRGNGDASWNDPINRPGTAASR